MSRIRANRRPPRGFTLLELLLVLVLIGISVAAVVPRFQGTLGGWQLRETARNVQAALQLGFQWARVRQEPVAFVLNVRQGTFSLRSFQEGQLTDKTLPATGRQALGQGVEVARVEGLEDVGREKVLVFRPEGASEPATIVLTGSRMGTASHTLWQIDLDGRGTVHCREKDADEKGR